MLKNEIQKQEQKRGVRRRNKPSLILINKALFFTIFVIGLFFVLSVNDLSIKSFVLQDLKMKEKILLEEKEKIELEVAKRKTFEHISERAISLNMVKVEKIDYIKAEESQMAKR